MFRIKRKSLAQFFKCSESTIELYLSRAEFAHIIKEKWDKSGIIYIDITKNDINRLKQLIYRNR